MACVGKATKGKYLYATAYTVSTADPRKVSKLRNMHLEKVGGVGVDFEMATAGGSGRRSMYWAHADPLRHANKWVHVYLGLGETC